MGQQEPCCGHDHYGENEWWLSVDDFVDLIHATVWHELRLPADQRPDLDERDHAAIRDDFERRRASRVERDAPRAPTRRERMQARLWGTDQTPR